jgi:hypothetical protein
LTGIPPEASNASVGQLVIEVSWQVADEEDLVAFMPMVIDSEEALRIACETDRIVGPAALNLMASGSSASRQGFASPVILSSIA